MPTVKRFIAFFFTLMLVADISTALLFSRAFEWYYSIPLWVIMFYLAKAAYRVFVKRRCKEKTTGMVLGYKSTDSFYAMTDVMLYIEGFDVPVKVCLSERLLPEVGQSVEVVYDKSLPRLCMLTTYIRNKFGWTKNTHEYVESLIVCCFTGCAIFGLSAACLITSHACLPAIILFMTAAFQCFILALHRCFYWHTRQEEIDYIEGLDTPKGLYAEAGKSVC